MKTSMQNYKKRLVALNVMLLVVVLLAGVSYAVFTGYSSQTDTNALVATCIDLEFSGINEINLTNNYPIKDLKGLEQTPYTFTIKNKCDNYIEYYVIASVINASTSADSKYIKVSLLGDNDMSPSVITSLKQISTPQSLSSYNIKENYVLKEGDGITKDESRSFDFRMWLDGENQTSWTSEELENKTYQVKISVVGTVKTRPKDDLFVATTINGKASSTFPETGLYAASVSCTQNNKTVDIGATIKWTGSKWSLGVTNLTSGNTKCDVAFDPPIFSKMILANNGVKKTITVPGTAISTAEEAILASTPDDYGTSYYFRGNVKNNYVQFAFKCWRVVRVNGDGSVKIVLHNDNTENSSNPCSSSNNNDTAAFAKYSGTTYTTKFNENYNDNVYIGFMYGKTSASTYALAHNNVYKSTILTNLETWYINNLASYDSRVADVIWCNDKSTFTTYTDGTTYGTGLGYSANITGYSTWNRIAGGSSISNAKPSLICPKDTNNGKLSKFTVNDTTNGNSSLTYKVGLLTADEIAFAGSVYGTSNQSSYLQENTGTTRWWTLSPYDYDGSYSSVLGVESSFLYHYRVHNSFGLRPAISILSTILISGGTGTSEDPYIVK